MMEFVELRLGRQASPAALLGEMLRRAFGASSFDRFWRFWNPVYGYGLYYWCYRPLRQRLPSAWCVLLTFAASGFLLHDLPFGWWVRLIRFFGAGPFPIPLVTLWFVLMGGLVLLCRGLRVDYGAWPFAGRAAINAGCVLAALLAALGLGRLAG